MKCTEPAVKQEELTPQISSLLSEYIIPTAWASKLETMLVKDEQTASSSSALFVADAQTKIVVITGKLQRLLDGYLDQDIEQSVYRTKQNALMSEKKSLEEQCAKLTLTQSSWVEPMRKWIKQAVSICEVAKQDDLLAKKLAVKEIFGLNLIFSNKKVRLRRPEFQKSPLEKHWTALCAARQKSEKSENISESPFWCG